MERQRSGNAGGDILCAQEVIAQRRPRVQRRRIRGRSCCGACLRPSSGGADLACGHPRGFSGGARGLFVAARRFGLGKGGRAAAWQAEPCGGTWFLRHHSHFGTRDHPRRPAHHRHPFPCRAHPDGRSRAREYRRGTVLGGVGCGEGLRGSGGLLRGHIVSCADLVARGGGTLDCGRGGIAAGPARRGDQGRHRERGIRLGR